jgi:two-component system, cell cycle sensor histidine kinase and response regulator CckA
LSRAPAPEAAIARSVGTPNNKVLVHTGSTHLRFPLAATGTARAPNVRHFSSPPSSIVSSHDPGGGQSSPPEAPRILLVEDVDADAELIVRELRRAGLTFTSERVQSEAALRQALEQFGPDIVLSDHSLPSFNAWDALRVVQRERPHAPVIIVTGSLDEETAAEYIKAGAIDYVVKHRLFRLGSAVRRALALQRAQTDAARAEAALRKLEDERRQAQKMEAIGRLASGVAHDFNNVLAVITTCCDLALAELAPDAPPRRDLLEIQDAAARATQLTRQLLAFSRQQPVTPQRVDLNALVDNMTGMLHRLLGGTVTASFVPAPAPALGAVWADPGQLEQVVMNLAVNARDAMPHGGQLTLETREVEVGASHAAVHGAQPGRYVVLTVTDTGTGMDADTRAHLFEPFFTTKPKGKGTGLGLATVYGIVQQAGGFIQVESEPGRGSTFRIFLPRVAP